MRAQIQQQYICEHCKVNFLVHFDNDKQKLYIECPNMTKTCPLKGKRFEIPEEFVDLKELN